MVTVWASLSASIDLELGWRDCWALTTDVQSNRRVSSIVLFMRVIVIRELEIGKELITLLLFHDFTSGLVMTHTQKRGCRSLPCTVH